MPARALRRPGLCLSTRCPTAPPWLAACRRLCWGCWSSRHGCLVPVTAASCSLFHQSVAALVEQTGRGKLTGSRPHRSFFASKARKETGGVGGAGRRRAEVLSSAMRPVARATSVHDWPSVKISTAEPNPMHGFLNNAQQHPLPLSSPRHAPLSPAPWCLVLSCLPICWMRAFPGRPMSSPRCLPHITWRA